MYDFLFHRILKVPYRLHEVTDLASNQPHTTLVFIHGIGSSHKMWRKTQQELRSRTEFDSVQFISVDLLGFGQSPRPNWIQYDTVEQARSLYKTLKSITHGSRILLVGHSLGALVAVEYAKLYSDNVDELILCSPPFYRQTSTKLPTRSLLLQKTYEEIAKNPSISEKVLVSLQKYAVVNEGYSIDEANAPIFIRTLRSSIMNQTAYVDALNLTVPTTVLSGILDPVVIDANLSSLAKQSEYISQKRIALAAHEISPIYRKELIKTLRERLLLPGTGAQ